MLLLDSDNLPVQDPALLFDSPPFVQHGFMAWPDFWRNLWMEPAVYKVLNLSLPWEVDPAGLAAESGQVVVDRARHADVLEWLWLLNAHAGLVYRCIVGDKDTLRIAFQLAGKGQHYWQVGVVGGTGPAAAWAVWGVAGLQSNHNTCCATPPPGRTCCRCQSRHGSCCLRLQDAPHTARASCTWAWGRRALMGQRSCSCTGQRAASSSPGVLQAGSCGRGGAAASPAG